MVKKLLRQEVKEEFFYNIGLVSNVQIVLKFKEKISFFGDRS